METGRKRIKLKCRGDGDIKNFYIDDSMTFQQVKKRVSADFGCDLIMKYEDKDGDLVSFSNQSDLESLFLSNVEKINVIITEQTFPQIPVRGSTRSQTITSSSTNIYSNERKSSYSSVGRGLSSNMSYLSNSYHFPSIFESPDTLNFPVKSQIRWKKSHVIGKGGFGTVYIGLNIDTGELMAVKQMNIDEVSAKELNTLQNEIDLLKRFNHPNIVRYIGTELSSTCLSIFLEYVTGGSLKSLVETFGPLDENVVRLYTRQLLLGLEYLHRKGIAHRDIKGANCLVGNDGVVKLADFGHSRQWRNAELPTSPKESEIPGTLCWMAPELTKGIGKNISWKKADCWSLACTTLEIVSGKPPWCQFQNNAVAIAYHIGCVDDSLPEYPPNLSVELISFLNTCLRRDPSQRPDPTPLLLHPFVANLGAILMNNGNSGSHQTRPTTVSFAPQNPLSLWSSRRGSRVDDLMPIDRDINYNLSQDGNFPDVSRENNGIATLSPIDRNTLLPPRVSSRLGGNLETVSQKLLTIDIVSPPKTNAQYVPECSSDPQPEMSTISQTGVLSPVSSVSDSIKDEDHDIPTEDGASVDGDDVFSVYEQIGNRNDAFEVDNLQEKRDQFYDIPVVPMDWKEDLKESNGMAFPAPVDQGNSLHMNGRPMKQKKNRYLNNPISGTVTCNDTESFSRQGLNSDALSVSSGTLPPPIEQDLSFSTPTSINSRPNGGQYIQSHFNFSPDKKSSIASNGIMEKDSVKSKSKQYEKANNGVTNKRSNNIHDGLISSPGPTTISSVRSDSQTRTVGDSIYLKKNTEGKRYKLSVNKSSSAPTLEFEKTKIASEEYKDIEDYHFDDAEVIENTTPLSLEEHKGSVTRLKACRQFLLSSSVDGTIRMWVPHEKESRIVFEVSGFQSSDKKSDRKMSARKQYNNTEKEDAATGIKVLNMYSDVGCEHIWGACSDGVIRVWNGADGKPIRQLNGHDDAVTLLEGYESFGSTNHAATLVASGSADKTVRIWDARSRRGQIFVLKGHTDGINVLRWGEGGRTVISAGKDKFIKVWDIRSGRLRVNIEKHFSAVTCITVVTDTTLTNLNNSSGVQPAFVSAGRDSMLYMWTGNGECIGSQSAHKGNIHFLSDMNFNTHYRNNPSSIGMISLSADNSMKIWDVKRNKLLGDVSPLANTGTSLKALWLRGHHFLTNCSNGAIKLWTYPSNVSPKVSDAKFNGNGVLDIGSPSKPIPSINSSDISCQELACHSQSATDLVVNDIFIASSSRSGQIFRWDI